MHAAKNRGVCAAPGERCMIHGRPRPLRCGESLECLADAMTASGPATPHISPFIEPGKPNSHTYIERFNKNVRTGMPVARGFASLKEAREVSEQSRHAYHTERSYESLERIAPLPFLPIPTAAPDPSDLAIVRSTGRPAHPVACLKSSKPIGHDSGGYALDNRSKWAARRAWRVCRSAPRSQRISPIERIGRMRGSPDDP